MMLGQQGVKSRHDVRSARTSEINVPVKKTCDFWIPLMNSVFSVSFFLFIVSFCSTFGIITYWGIQGTVWSVALQSGERRGLFLGVTEKLSFISKLIEKSGLQMDGMCDELGHLLKNRMEENEDGVRMNEVSAVKMGYQYFTALEDMLDLGTITSGWYLFENIDGEWQNYYHLEYASEKFLLSTNHTLDESAWNYIYDVVEVETDLDGKVQSFEVIPDSHVAYKWDFLPFSEHYRYDHVAGYDSYFAFSSGGYVNKDLVETPGNLTCVTWIGVDIITFSEFLKQWTPDDSFSWVFVVSTNELLVVSEYVDETSVLNSENSWFADVTNCKDPRISRISKVLLESGCIQQMADQCETGIEIHDEVHGEDHGKMNHELHEMNVQEFHLEMMLVHSHYSGGDLLFVNAKELWKIYSPSVTAVVGTSTMFLFVAFFVVVLWIVVIFRICNGRTLIVKELEKIQSMSLDELLDSKDGCARTSHFTEIRFFLKQIQFLGEKLKLYRTFIPSHLLYLLSEPPKGHHHRVSGGSSGSSYNDSVEGSCGSGPIDRLSNGASSSNASSVLSKALAKDLFSVGLFEKEIVYIIFKFAEASSLLFHTILESFERLNIHVVRFESDCIYSFCYGKIETVMLAVERFLNLPNLREGCVFLGKGEVRIGNVGSENQKMLSCEGKVVKQTCFASQYLPKWASGCRVVVTEPVAEMLKGGFEVRSICQLGKLPHLPQFELFEIGRRTNIEANEWMYELAQIQSLKRWDTYNESIDDMKSSKYKSASLLMKTFLGIPKNAKDPVGEYWKNQIDLKIAQTERRSCDRSDQSS